MKDIQKNVENTIEDMIDEAARSISIARLINIKQWLFEQYYGAKSPYLTELEQLSIKLDIRSLGGKSWTNLESSLENELWIKDLIKFLKEETEREMTLIVSDFPELDDKFLKIKWHGHTFIATRTAQKINS